MPNLDDNAKKVAELAAAEAVHFLEQIAPPVSPTVAVSEDGLISLRWRRAERGMLLIFSGDGQVSYSFRRPGQYYAENGIEGPVSGPVPPEFTAAIENLQAS